MTSAPLPRARRALLAIGLLMVAVLAACGRTAGVTTTQASGTLGEVLVVETPPEPVAGPPATPPPLPVPVRAESREDLLDETRAAPHRVWLDPADPRLLHVGYANGVAPCYGARVAIDEGPATVRVLLYTGKVPDSGHGGCYTVALAHEIVVPLDRPLGSREVIW